MHPLTTVHNRLLIDYKGQLDYMMMNNKSTLYVDFQHVMQVPTSQLSKFLWHNYLITTCSLSISHRPILNWLRPSS